MTTKTRVTKIGLIPHLKKREAVRSAREILDWLGERGVKGLLDPRSAEALGLPELSFGEGGDLKKKMDVAVVLGGDGALLYAARMLSPSGLPVLGVNVGHLGFLTEIELTEVYDSLERVINGDYEVEERMMVAATIRRHAKDVEKFTGLNDIVVTKGAFSRMIRLETYIDDHHIGTYPADGVIVASPTGSTAYSLSAGGPIVNPRMDTLIITFICPHTLFARAFVISGSETVRVVVHSSHDDVMVTVDGQLGYRLGDGDEVTIKKAGHKTRLVKLTSRSFYEVLKTKLSEGNI
ncbi:MAG TPA: NAD(+)/NADH kinase [Firmicutes bacterium]|nr:NAD(+)/NADH kinase [Bacillota bacterium]